MRPISADKKNAAVQLLSQGLSIRKVAMQVGIGAATVGRIAQNMPHRVGIRGGRPCLLSDADNRKITRDITTGNYNTAVQVTAGLAEHAGVVVSVNTVCRVLKKNGLHSAQKIKKPMLSLRHRNAR